ncbi:MAG: sensor histidine kinase, partial [Acidobacteriota bacterium]
SQDLARINLGHYIQSFVTHLFHAYEVDTSQIKMLMDTEDVQVDINTAIPCGLILNELVSNALKHAFPSGQRGEVNVRLSKNKEGKINLTVKDNGRGLPREVNLHNPKSLGLQLIKDLTKQLNGEVKVQKTKGSKFTVTF